MVNLTEGLMGSMNDVDYRLQLVRGFLDEARQDFAGGRWRAAVSGSVLAVENAGVGVLMLFGVAPTTHRPGEHLSRLMVEGTLSTEVAGMIGQLLPLFERHGSHQKMLTKYGDEEGCRLPWDIFGEGDAREALASAETAMRIASETAAVISSSGGKVQD
ncbi:MAG: hypothetical protein HQ516_00885 [Chlorobium sp.]|nr:hypothetical protein [Chlorobium sp.]